MDQPTASTAKRAFAFQADFSATELSDRRRRVLEAIGGRASALLQGAPLPDGFELFRQWNDFYYLTGVEAPHAYLLLDGARESAVLYLPPRNEKRERSEGPSISCDDSELVREWTGVEEVRPLEALTSDLAGRSLLYLPHNPSEGTRMCRDTLREARHAIASDPLNKRIAAESNFLAQVRAVAPQAEVRDLSPILDEFRVLKSPAEVALMRRAGRLSALAVTEAMRCTRPGLMEYHLGAVADYFFLVNGGRGGAYRPIIAGGANAWCAHYYRNDCPLRDGDLVLMDYAPDVGYYTSDIGRMWPVNGRYADWQRELYGLIVEYHQALLRHIRPGVSPGRVMEEAAAVMRPKIERTRFSKPCYREGALRLLDFPGHFSHPVGMAVHDVGDYHRHPLRPGTVFALDPQMWIPGEQLYIRVEDTIAITDDGYENLTADAPLELDEVERTVQQGGLLQAYPPLSLRDLR